MGSLPVPSTSSWEVVSVRTLWSSEAVLPDQRISLISESLEMVPLKVLVVPAVTVEEVKVFLTPLVSKT